MNTASPAILVIVSSGAMISARPDAIRAIASIFARRKLFAAVWQDWRLNARAVRLPVVKAVFAARVLAIVVSSAAVSVSSFARLWVSAVA